VALTDEDAVREWVGASPSAGDITAALNRYDDDPLLAARSILRRRLADFALTPNDLNVDGDFARKITKDQIALLDDLIARATAAVGGEEESTGTPSISVARLSRDTPVR
jgi:hypothetical protein